jgi:formate/nitrite transporter FocA (FNT family)
VGADSGGDAPGEAGRRADGRSDSAWSFDALMPADIARRAEAVGVAKASTRFHRLVVLGVLAGAFISLGAVFSTVVTAGGGMAPGVSRLLGGLTFSLGSF